MTELNLNHSTFIGTANYANAISDSSDHESPRNENRFTSKLVIVEPSEDRSDESFQNESVTENNELLTLDGSLVPAGLIKSETQATCNSSLSIKIPLGRYEISKVPKPQINLRATSMMSPTQKTDNGHVNFINVAKPRSTPAREAVDPAKYYILNDEPDGTKYACSKCGNVYKWRKSLNKHWKEKHEGEAPPSQADRERMLKCPPQNFQKHSALQVTPTINSAKSILFPTTAVSLSNFKSNPIRIPTNLYTLVNVRKTAEAITASQTNVGRLQSSHSPNTIWKPHNIKKDYKDVSPAHQGNLSKYKSSVASSKPVYDDCGALDLSFKVSSDQDMPLDFSSKSSNPGGWSEDESTLNDLRTKSMSSTGEDQEYTCFQCQMKFSQLFDLNSHFACQHMNSLYEVADDNISTKDHLGYVSSKKCSTDNNEGVIQCVICGFTEKWDWQMFKHFDGEHYGIEPNPYKTLSINYTESKNISNSIPDSPVESSSNNSLNAEMLKKFGLSDNSVLDLESQGTAIVIPKAPEETALHVRNPTHRQKSQDKFTEDGTAYMMSDSMEEPASENVRVSFGGKSGRGKKDSSIYIGDVVLPYECKLCGYRARWPSEMTQHMKNHSDEKPYQCPQCSYRSKWKWDVVKHLKRCGGNKDQQNESLQKRKRTFPKSFPEISSSDSNNDGFSNGRTDHRDISRGPPNITIYSNDRPKKRCYEGGTSPQDADGPSNEHHSNLHPCDQCYFVGHSPAELRRHMRVHSDEKPYSCNTCNYSSKWKCDLKKHLRTYNHVPAVPMDQGASKKSSDSQDVFDGSMTSQEEKMILGGEVFFDTWLKCKKCSYEATNMTAYIEHVSKHTDVDSQTSADQISDENENSEMDIESKKMKLMISLGLYQVTTDDSSQPDTEKTVNVNNEQNNYENGFLENEEKHKNQIFHHHGRENAEDTEAENKSTESEILDCSTRIDETLNNCKYQERSSSNSKVSSKLFTLQESTIGNVRLRLITKSDKQFYGCLKCHYVSRSSFRAVYHSRQHGSQKTFKCTFCDYSNNQLTFVQKHTASLHGEENNNFRKSSDICFKRIDHFRILNRMNLKLRKNVCISCGYASLSETSMIKHRLTRPCSQLLIKHPMHEHAGDIFSCDKCSFRTDEQLTMVNHLKGHGSDYKHKCLKCDFSTALTNVILIHKKHHH